MAGRRNAALLAMSCILGGATAVWIISTGHDAGSATLDRRGADPALSFSAAAPAASTSSVIPVTPTDSNALTSTAASTASTDSAVPEITEHSLPSESPEPPPASRSVRLQVPAMNQLPELYNGCEVTSLAMLLAAAGHPADKMSLAKWIAKDNTSPEWREDGSVAYWGDPNIGFVGDMEGNDVGYGVYHGPVAALMNEVWPGHAVDLTGSSFDNVLKALNDGRPVVVWTNDHFSPETEWVTWETEKGSIRTTWHEHVVLLTGYDDERLYLNDPLDGTADKPVERDAFIASWGEMGRQAITFSIKEITQ